VAEPARDEDTKVVPIVPVPPPPKGFILIPIATLGALTTMVVGACLLLSQVYVSVIQHDNADGLLVGAGVTLLSAGTVAELRSHRNGHP
jgi:hypothetical protein